MTKWTRVKLIGLCALAFFPTLCILVTKFPRALWEAVYEDHIRAQIRGAIRTAVKRGGILITPPAETVQ